MQKFTHQSRRPSLVLAMLLMLLALPMTASASVVAGPVVTVVETPVDPSRSPAATFKLSSPAAAKLQCRLDAGAFEACVSGVGYDKLADGSHTFTVYGVDVFGNAGPEASYTWQVDTTRPDTSITQAPVVETASKVARLEFTADTQGATFECRLDERPAELCSSPLEYGDLPDGVHTFHVVAIDRAGNKDEQPAAWTWTVDTAGPVVLLTHANGVPPGSARASIEIASEQGARFECQLDAGELVACTSPVPFSGLTDGSHTLTVHAFDHLENEGPPASITWQVDTTPPDTTITAGPSGTVTGPSTSFAFRSSTPGATFECALDGAAFARCVSPTALSKLGGGLKRWRVRAVSPGGNVDPTPATRTWVVDATGPIVNIHGGPAAGSTTTSTSASFTLDANERNVTFQCAMDAQKPASCSARERRTGLANGSHTFTVIAVDRFGNVGPPAMRRWTIVPRRR